MLTKHHIISDGWSMNNYIQELAALYRAYHYNQHSPMTDFSIKNADYAAWQRDWLQAE
jgi:hypothetical protein